MLIKYVGENLFVVTTSFVEIEVKNQINISTPDNSIPVMFCNVIPST